MRYRIVFISMLLLLLLGCTMTRLVQSPGIQLPDANSQIHQLMHSTKRATVFIFVGVDCPVSNSYAPEINRIITDYSTQIDFYLVYADPILKPEQVKAHSDSFKFTCPSLLDPHHELVDRFHAKLTPEVVVVDEQMSVLYQGRIDDRYQSLGRKRFAATKHDLRDALDEVIHHQPIAVPKTQAVGCEI